ncbi:MAG TPA: hypothetical protein VIK91_11635 [Nannocystis sp.]
MTPVLLLIVMLVCFGVYGALGERSLVVDRRAALRQTLEDGIIERPRPLRRAR